MCRTPAVSSATSNPQMSRAVSVASATSQAFHLRHLANCPWAECNFTVKNLLCNFCCRLLVHSSKSLILLAYILYCLKKYTYRSCAYFVVLGGIIFKSKCFPPEVSSSTCSSACPDQESQRASDFVDKCGLKTDRKNVFRCSFVIFPLTLESS